MSTLATVARIVGHRRAQTVAAQLPEPALGPTLPAVVPVFEHVPAMVLAAAQQLGRPIPRGHTGADVLLVLIAADALLDVLLQEPAPGPRVKAQEVLCDGVPVLELVFGCNCNAGECNQEEDGHREAG